MKPLKLASLARKIIYDIIIFNITTALKLNLNFFLSKFEKWNGNERIKDFLLFLK